MHRSLARSLRQLRSFALALFLTSGAAGLVLQVVWTRLLTTVFGSTVFAASTVVTSFMLGLALGSTWLGRWADRCPRNLAFYGVLEIGVGVYALLFPWLIEWSTGWHIAFFRAQDPGPIALNGFRLAWALLVLLPPTVLMGATLPVLGRFVAASAPDPGREVGYLYGANTLGAVAGAFLAGYVLIERLGVIGTLQAAGLTAVLVGFSALVPGLLLERGEPLPKAAAPVAPAPANCDPAAGLQRRSVWLTVFALTGFCALAYEILWVRILIFVLGTSVHAFATMLTTFLAGNALGALFTARFLLPRVRNPLTVFGTLQSLLGISALTSVVLLGRLGTIDLGWVTASGDAGPWQPAVNAFAQAALIMLAPTLLMGAAFPLMVSALARGGAARGRRIGELYAANTLGCVLGSLAAGFVLFPWLGTQHSLWTIALLNLLVGSGVVILATPRARRWPRRAAWLAPAVGLAIGTATPADALLRTINAHRAGSRLVFVEENPAGTVTVHDLPNGERLIAVDGVDVASRDYMLRTTQKLQGYLPLLLHPNPRRVVQIGFGSGETARVGLEYGVQDYTVVEICPAVFRAGPFFEELNRGSYRDPRIRRVIMDGKNFALLSGEKFDVLMNDSIFPGSSGSSALYNLDHFRNCRDRLAQGGIFSCWVPLDLRPSEMAMILKSFQDVFPHTSFWMASNCLNKHGVIIGSDAPLHIDFQRIRDRMQDPAVQADLAPVHLDNVYDLLDCHVLDAPAIARLVASSPITSDSWPRLEFSCARKVAWQSRLLGDLVMLASAHAPVTPWVFNFVQPERDAAELTARAEATRHILRAQIAQLAFQPKLRRRELDAALAAHPGEIHVQTCEDELQRETRDLQAMVRHYPNVRVFRQRLADKYYLALRYPEAEQIYQHLIRQGGVSHADIFVRLAEIQYHFGRAAEAEATLLHALTIWPADPEIHDRLAGIYMQAGRLAEARHHSALALKAAPDHPVYLSHREAIEAAR